MKILQIIPGSGGSFYCGNCLRDSKYVDALRKMGHPVVKLPMYLPLFGHDDSNGEVPVFYGAIGTYLQQVYPIFRKAPAWLTRLLNSKPMMKMAASMAGSTDAKGLDEMTVSMLLGEHGKQKEELERMVDWISETPLVFSWLCVSDDRDWNLEYFAISFYCPDISWSIRLRR